MRAYVPAIAAPAPANSAIHGAMAGFVNGGGFRTANSDPTTTTAPATIATVRATDGRRANATHRARPITAAEAASIDQRTSIAQAPANPDPVLKRVHGSRVASAATASDAPVTRSAGDRNRLQVRGGVDAGMSFPRTSDRHSGPSTRPLTGTAHSTQSGRPQTAHVSTVSRDGWFAQRSEPLVVRSSVGIAEAYAASPGASDA